MLLLFAESRKTRIPLFGWSAVLTQLRIQDLSFYFVQRASTKTQQLDGNHIDDVKDERQRETILRH